MSEIKQYIRPELEQLARQILTFSGDIGKESPSDEFWEKANMTPSKIHLS